MFDVRHSAGLILVIAILGFGIMGCADDCTPEPPKSTAVESPHADLKPQSHPTYTKRSEGKYCESRFLRAHDKFLSADSPDVVSAAKARFLEDDDEVLGFVVDGQPRAYSVRMLCYHHVVNDQIGKTPIAVTY